MSSNMPITRYPGFDVTKEQHEWDQHTRQVVIGRLQAQRGYQWLEEQEAMVVLAIAEQLVLDDRTAILSFMAHHLDQQLASQIGENQRENGVPPVGELIRTALLNLDRAARTVDRRGFLNLAPGERKALLQKLEQGVIDWLPGWESRAQQAAFSKLSTSLVKAYYAYPTIWSEIGYAGPAYPRGYVRSEFGLTDPWEARR